MNVPTLLDIELELQLPAACDVRTTCAVLSNVTLEVLYPYLRYFVRHDAIELHVQRGNFDNVLQDAFASSGVEGSNSTLVLLWLPALSPQLAFQFSKCSAEGLESEICRVQAYCEMTIAALRARGRQSILWCGFEASCLPPPGIARGTEAISFRVLIERLNEFVRSRLADAGNAHFVDIAVCQERIGTRSFYDWRYWFAAKAPFSREGCAEIAKEVSKYLRALHGKTRKCLVLDCDNTLWGGIVGEVGPHAVSVKDTGYEWLQRTLLTLHHRGVVLAINSKNNEADVLRVFREHPYMLLREHHFSALRINWNNKADNVRELSDQLGIATSAMVFVDDEEFEINLVRSLLPEVACLHVPSARASENWRVIADIGLFDALALTTEDLQRGHFYQQDEQRKAAANASLNLMQYLESLRMQLQLLPATMDDLDRLEQLSLRTNQFNLTNLRLTHGDLLHRLRSREYLLTVARLTDRFGDYGTVGLCVARCGQVAEIELFVISCRALGRGVDTALLEASMSELLEAGAHEVRASYVPTDRNAQVADFYPRHGFVDIDVDGLARTYRYSRDCAPIEVPAHFFVVGQEVEGVSAR